MAFRMSKDFKQMLYPYMFVLKEGPGFEKDYLDYSLLMLQVNTETIKSPAHLKKRKGTTAESDLFKPMTGITPF